MRVKDYLFRIRKLLDFDTIEIMLDDNRLYYGPSRIPASFLYYYVDFDIKPYVMKYDETTLVITVQDVQI